MDYKEANENIALHNMNCEDGKYKKVLALANEDIQLFVEIIPIRFFDNGKVVDIYYHVYSEWKPIEDETSSEETFEINQAIKTLENAIDYIDKSGNCDDRPLDYPNGDIMSIALKTLIDKITITDDRLSESQAEAALEIERLKRINKEHVSQIETQCKLIKQLNRQINSLQRNSKKILNKVEKAHEESDILRRAKEICFKTGYVRNKFWSIDDFASVESGERGYFFVVYSCGGSRNHTERLNMQEIVEEWESVDPMED